MSESVQLAVVRTAKPGREAEFEKALKHNVDVKFGRPRQSFTFQSSRKGTRLMPADALGGERG